MKNDRAFPLVSVSSVVWHKFFSPNINCTNNLATAIESRIKYL
jgi:hypothetical protein